MLFWYCVTFVQHTSSVTSLFFCALKLARPQHRDRLLRGSSAAPGTMLRHRALAARAALARRCSTVRDL